MLNLIPVAGLDDTVEVDNPWGFTDQDGHSALVLRIGSTESRGWRRHQATMQARAQVMTAGAAKYSSSVEQAASKGARKGGAAELRAAELGASSWEKKLGERLDGFIREDLDERPGEKAMAEHLFEIVRCNFYGLPVTDSLDNRLRLLSPIAQCDPRQVCEWREGSPIMAVPEVGPADRAEWGSPHWARVVREHLPTGADAVRAAWEALRRAGKTSSELADTPYVDPGEKLVPLHFLVQRWILDIAQENANRMALAQAEVTDFLPAPPDSGAGSGEA